MIFKNKKKIENENIIQNVTHQLFFYSFFHCASGFLFISVEVPYLENKKINSYIQSEIYLRK